MVLFGKHPSCSTRGVPQYWVHEQKALRNIFHKKKNAQVIWAIQISIRMNVVDLN